jgi:hypothetical protein
MAARPGVPASGPISTRIAVALDAPAEPGKKAKA